MSKGTAQDHPTAVADSHMGSEKAASDRKIRETNSLRFVWHEHVLKDPVVRRNPNALAIAGHIMHRFNSTKGYAEISAGSIARDLKIPENSAKRSIKFLLKRGWMQVKEPYLPCRHWRGTRYTFSGGPDDHLLDEHGIDDESSGEDS